jgi:hypothetical protein
MPQAPTRGRVPPAQRGLVVPHDLPAPAQFGHHERGVAGRVPGRLPEHPAIPRIERHQRRRRPAGVDDQPALDEERGAGVAPLRNRRPEFPRQFPLPQRLPVPGRNAMQMPERAQQIRPAAVNQRSGPRRLPVIQIAHRRVIELPHQLAIGHPERQKHIPLVERIPIGHEHQTLGDREPRQTRPAQRLAPDPVGPARQPIRQPNRPTIPAPPTPVRPAVGSGLVPNRRGRRRRGSVRARTRSGRSRFGRGQIAGHPAVAGFELLQQVGVFADLAQRGLKGAGLRGRQGGRGETGDKGNRLRLGQNAQGAPPEPSRSLPTAGTRSSRSPRPAVARLRFPPPARPPRCNPGKSPPLPRLEPERRRPSTPPGPPGVSPPNPRDRKTPSAPSPRPATGPGRSSSPRTGRSGWSSPPDRSNETRASAPTTGPRRRDAPPNPSRRSSPPDARPRAGNPCPGRPKTRPRSAPRSPPSEKRRGSGNSAGRNHPHTGTRAPWPADPSPTSPPAPRPARVRIPPGTRPSPGRARRTLPPRSAPRRPGPATPGRTRCIAPWSARGRPARFRCRAERRRRKGDLGSSAIGIGCRVARAGDGERA